MELSILPSACYKRLAKRIKADDPVALNHKGSKYYKDGDYANALKYLTKAAELGDMNANFQLGQIHGRGQGVKADEEKAVQYLEKAAIGGHPGARYVLGNIERCNDRLDRAVKHYIIAANHGSDESIRMLRMQ